MAIHLAQPFADYIRAYRDQDANTLPDAACEQFVRAVEGQLSWSLQEHPRMHVRRSYPLGAGDNTIPVPKDMMQLLNVKLNGATLTQYPQNLEEKAIRCGGYVNYGNCIRVWRVPTETTTYTLEMGIAIPSLVDELQLEENWVARYHAHVYHKGLLAETAGYLGDQVGYQFWQGLFEGAVQRLAAQGWNESYADAPRIHAV
jgi:hypothetical protein